MAFKPTKRSGISRADVDFKVAQVKAAVQGFNKTASELRGSIALLSMKLRKVDTDIATIKKGLDLYRGRGKN